MRERALIDIANCRNLAREFFEQGGGDTGKLAAGKDRVGRIDAISVETGRTVWSWETRVSNYSPILATAGGLLFNGSMDRYLRALDADRGTVRWQTRLPSQVVGTAITYAVDGRQYVVVGAGDSLYAFYLQR